MRLIWTKSNAPLSVLIRAITGQDCSHFALVLYEKSPGPIVFESNLLGTHPKFYQTFLKHCSVVHEKIFDLPQETEDKIMDLIVKKYDGLGYDFGGVFYLGWRILIKRLFKFPLPEKNKWASVDKFFCDEVYDILNHIDGFQKLDAIGAMNTPCDTWIKLKGFADA